MTRRFFHPSLSARIGAFFSAALLAFSLPSHGGSLDVVVKAFEKDKDYVQPFATIFGSTTNSGWYQSASVAKGFGFYLGLPLNATIIADGDRSFKGTWVDSGCQIAHQKNPSAQCDETTSFRAPTIFGTIPGPVLHTTVPDQNGNIVTQLNNARSDGRRALSSFNWLPFGEPQLSFSYYYTELKLRYFGLPLPMASLSLPGFGLQHDFASFLPPLPVSISAVTNMTWLSASWTPGHGIDGTMDLTGFSHFTGLLVGYTYARWAEVFMEAGWEGSSLKTGGHLHLIDANEDVNPNLSIDGRNGFRAAINVAFHFGYDAVFGENFGSELGSQVGVLAYRYKK